MLLVRLAIEADFKRIVELGAMNAAETMPDDPFSENRAYELLYQYIDTANPTFFVVEDARQRDVFAFLMATMNLFDHRDGFFTCQKVLFVRPDKRGTRAAVLLMKELIRWSQSIGAVSITGGNDNGFKSDRTAGFLEHFGFRKVGYSMTMRLDRDDGRKG